MLFKQSFLQEPTDLTIKFPHREIRPVELLKSSTKKRLQIDIKFITMRRSLATQARFHHDFIPMRHCYWPYRARLERRPIRFWSGIDSFKPRHDANHGRPNRRGIWHISA